MDKSKYGTIGLIPALILVVFSMFFASDKVKTTEGTEGNINDARLIFDMPENYTLENAARLFDSIEDSIRVKADIYGLKTINSRHSHNWGVMRIFLKRPPNRDWYEVVYDNILKNFGVLPGGVMERDDVVEDIKKRLPTAPGVEIRTSWRQEGVGNESSIAVVLSALS